MDCSLPGSSVHGISQARILVWVTISSSRASSHPGIEPGSQALAGDSLPLSHQGSPTGQSHKKHTARGKTKNYSKHTVWASSASMALKWSNANDNCQGQQLFWLLVSQEREGLWAPPLPAGGSEGHSPECEEGPHV